MVGARTWWAIVVVGLAGQLAWVIENMYLNLYIHHRVSADPAVIALTVAVSAVAATVATIVAGAWSDRVGRRRPFIAAGYGVWGLLTAAFGLVGNHTGAAVATGFGAAAAAIVAVDALMTLAGSTANDAAYNAWVTDVTTPANRGRVDAVIATFPLLAMLLVFGLLDPLTQQGRWQVFFGLVGAITSSVGVVAWFLVRDRVVTAPSTTGASAVWRAFSPSSIRRNPLLWWALGLLAAVGIATQVFMPYLMIYLQDGLALPSYTVVLGVVLIVASALSVVGGRVMDRVGKAPYLLACAVVYALGLAGMALVRDSVGVGIAGTVMMFGMLACTAAATAMTRDATPPDAAGVVQGLRIVAAVLVPMVVGPAIGAAVISGAGRTYDDLGVAKPVPGPSVFAVAAAVLVAVPLVWWGWRRQAARASVGEGR